MFDTGPLRTVPTPMPALLDHPDVIGYEQLPENSSTFTAQAERCRFTPDFRS